MNRVDFMEQLEHLLQSISPAERDEALQYYNDYFDDAGRENEQEVIEALGNPARVAENIKRDLLGGGYGGAPAPRASDRVIIEYGKETAAGEQSPDEGKAGEPAPGSPYGTPADSGFHGDSQASRGAMDREAASGCHEEPRREPDSCEMPARKEGMPPWAAALLVTLLIFASPVLLGLACSLFAVVICWYAVIFAVGVIAVALFAVLVTLAVTGLLCMGTNPWVGMALLGGGLICGGIGMLFLMLTVAMAGIVTPAVWRGLRFLFGRKRAKKRLNQEA